MRYAALVLLGSTACFSESEWVRVRVPVYTGPAVVSIIGQSAPASQRVDACERAAQGAPDISTCQPVAYVRASGVVTEPNCYLDNKVKGGDVGRLLSCPDGAALVVFDGATFVGESNGSYVNVCKTTTYDFPQGDACTWRTEQRISGALDHGFVYAYSEAPVAGRACTLACRARADVSVIRER